MFALSPPIFFSPGANHTAAANHGNATAVCTATLRQASPKYVTEEGAEGRERRSLVFVFCSFLFLSSQNPHSLDRLPVSPDAVRNAVRVMSRRIGCESDQASVHQKGRKKNFR